MNQEDARRLLLQAWPLMVDEFRAVLGGELHYQAVAYHCLRVSGVPSRQIGMNVKQWIDDPVSELFRRLDARKHPEFQGGFEPIPDIVLFAPEVAGDWRRRNRANTLRHMLMAIEVKASERAGSRLRSGEIERDIRKLAAHREEVRHLGGDMLPVMMVVDVAPELNERMRSEAVLSCQTLAAAEDVLWMHVSPHDAVPAVP